MKKLAIIHFLPIEYYPPVTNLLDFLSGHESVSTRVWTNANNQQRLPYKGNKKTRIIRSPFTRSKEGQLVRLIKYFYFNLKTFWGLLKYRPTHILYYESYSAFPVYLYQFLISRSFKLFIHFHEYADPEWYETGMKVVKFYHRFELSTLYKKAIWISQTNEKRLSLFKNDHPEISDDKLKILANYPPMTWCSFPQRKGDLKAPVRFVYIGSLSLKDAYIKEFCNWIVNQNGNAIFDIYAYNLHADTIDYLSNLSSQSIRFNKEGVEYQRIPEVLSKYDVGVILYKANTDNYKYNASNKLFEYLALNLFVMYSDKMLGVNPYQDGMVQPFDFELIPDLPTVISKFDPKTENLKSYFAETEYQKLLSVILSE